MLLINLTIYLYIIILYRLIIIVDEVVLNAGIVFAIAFETVVEDR